MSGGAKWQCDRALLRLDLRHVPLDRVLLELGERHPVNIDPVQAWHRAVLSASRVRTAGGTRRSEHIELEKINIFQLRSLKVVPKSPNAS